MILFYTARQRYNAWLVADRLRGLDPHRLDIPVRKRLEIDHGRPIRAIMA